MKEVIPMKEVILRKREHRALTATEQPEPVFTGAAHIQILNWRSHGDDESSCEVRVFAANEPGDIQDQIRKDKKWPEGDADYDPENAGDFEKVYYVNDDLEFADGQILKTSDGRRLRLTLTEVTD